MEIRFSTFLLGLELKFGGTMRNGYKMFKKIQPSSSIILLVTDFFVKIRVSALGPSIFVLEGW